MSKKYIMYFNYDKFKEECSKTFDTEKEAIDNLKNYYEVWTITVDNEENEQWKVIHEYEKKSGKICEICGEVGEGRNLGHWLKTLCDKCYGDKKC